MGLFEEWRRNVQAGAAIVDLRVHIVPSVDDYGEINGFFIATPKMIEDAIRFGRIMCLDTTHKCLDFHTNWEVMFGSMLNSNNELRAGGVYVGGGGDNFKASRLLKALLSITDGIIKFHVIISDQGISASAFEGIEGIHHLMATRHFVKAFEKGIPPVLQHDLFPLISQLAYKCTSEEMAKKVAAKILAFPKLQQLPAALGHCTRNLDDSVLASWALFGRIDLFCAGLFEGVSESTHAQYKAHNQQPASSMIEFVCNVVQFSATAHQLDVRRLVQQCVTASSTLLPPRVVVKYHKMIQAVIAMLQTQEDDVDDGLSDYAVKIVAWNLARASNLNVVGPDIVDGLGT
jgi:hypothetical protein